MRIVDEDEVELDGGGWGDGRRVKILAIKSLVCGGAVWALVVLVVLSYFLPTYRLGFGLQQILGGAIGISVFVVFFLGMYGVVLGVRSVGGEWNIKGFVGRYY